MGETHLDNNPSLITHLYIHTYEYKKIYNQYVYVYNKITVDQIYCI